MFPFWDRPSETERAAMQAARAEQVAEHDAAVQRLRELADGDTCRCGAVVPADMQAKHTAEHERTEHGYDEASR